MRAFPRPTAASRSARPEAEAGADAAGPSPPPTAASSGTPTGDGVCEDCSCGGLPSAFANFPVSPRRTEMEDGELLVSFVLTGHEELQAIVDECEAAGLGVELRRLCVDREGRSAEDDCCRDVVPVDLAGVTDRQAEIAAVAAEKGYFDGDGASAGEIAADLDLAKSTVSEHLRTVTDTLFSQAFGDGS
ncbi:helix-turn-helix domain-containing protein [Halorubrum saccharovorum]|uniref:helix-turn-helix domain-containing protein n=1 Tax=Halorubrum saccharovorum TaxID=2248 RepID=UPI001F228890|nr:helix-turn-helix domain-containing protein [Halorubrum saccharovorum]